MRYSVNPRQEICSGIIRSAVGSNMRRPANPWPHPAVVIPAYRSGPHSLPADVVLASLLALSPLLLPAGAGAQPAFQLLHGFVDLPRRPVSAPVQASNGSLYGTTLDGAVNSVPCIASTRGGSFSVVHFFSGDDGDDPYAELTPASDGFLYGTTVFGGGANAGTIFRLELRPAR